MTAYELTVLSKTDRSKLEAEIHAEVAARLGERPTLALINQEMAEDRLLRRAIGAVHGLGRFTGVLIREGVSAVGALLLLVGFAVLEGERIYTGMMALDQAHSAALILAGGLVLANVTLPIYRLRRQRTGERLIVQRWTVRSQLAIIGHRIFGQAQPTELDVNHNPTLKVAEVVVLLATLFLAFYAVLGGTMQQYATLPWYAALGRSFGGTFEEFVPVVIGLAVSVGGVFMLQSVSHEVAVRAIEEKPQQARDVLAQRKVAYQSEVVTIREEITGRYMQAKVADKQRRPQAKQASVSVGADSELKNGTVHWQEAGWVPEPESYPCACGCGELVVWQGIGRRPKFISDAHRKRHDRRAENGRNA